MVKKKEIKQKKTGRYIVQNNDIFTYSNVQDARNKAIELLNAGCFFLTLKEEKE